MQNEYKQFEKFPFKGKEFEKRQKEPHQQDIEQQDDGQQFQDKFRKENIVLLVLCIHAVKADCDV